MAGQVKFVRTATESKALNNYNNDTVYFTCTAFTEGGYNKERRCIIMKGKKYSEYIAIMGSVSSGSGSGSGTGSGSGAG